MADKEKFLFGGLLFGGAVIGAVVTAFMTPFSGNGLRNRIKSEMSKLKGTSKKDANESKEVVITSKPQKKTPSKKKKNSEGDK